MRHLLLALLLGAAPVAAQQSAGHLLREAELAWEDGNYPAALVSFRRLLEGSSSASVLRPIALITGEYHRTTELTADGANPGFSPDGEWYHWESQGKTELRHVDGRRSATIAGVRASVAPGGGLVAVHPADRPGTVAIHSLPSGREVARLGDTRTTIAQARFGRSADELFLVAGDPADTTGNPILRATRQRDGWSIDRTPLAGGAGFRVQPVLLPGSSHLLYQTAPRNPLRGTGAPTFAVRPGLGGFALVDLAGGRVTEFQGSGASWSADGRFLTWVRRDGDRMLLQLLEVGKTEPRTIFATTEQLDAPALSPDGSLAVFQRMTFFDWELWTLRTDSAGAEPVRLTREIQHDLFPRFVNDRTVLAVIGEGRHRRSYLHDVTTGARTRLFHNNTVRTIAPEYVWSVSPDGTKVLIQAERDGDTVSPERGVYLTDLSGTVTREELLERIDRQLAHEADLRRRGEAIFAPIADQVRQVTGGVSVSRIFGYQQSLFAFDSKHITQPGNRKAIDYLAGTYRSFGYQPELQWFTPRGVIDGAQTANVIAVLPGTVHPELVYVVSSHFDSRAEGPGADDNTSGTAALLEAARVLRNHPQPATIVFASFTGEEAGLQGSREWVRRAIADSMKVVGALNNDMIGWANDQRLDNTIRYSNAGIRDVQHAAALQFSDLITYDALYYKSTDAAAYYEAWGDIVGGIGSYPVLGNPHYHQPHDVLETINHRLVAEVSRTTVATLMLLASSPSRLTGLAAEPAGSGAVRLRWTASPERDVTGYEVTWGPESDPGARTVRVTGAEAVIEGAPAGTVFRVRAVNARGLAGWDWAVVRR